MSQLSDLYAVFADQPQESCLIQHGNPVPLRLLQLEPGSAPATRYVTFRVTLLVASAPNSHQPLGLPRGIAANVPVKTKIWPLSDPSFGADRFCSKLTPAWRSLSMIARFAGSRK